VTVTTPVVAVHYAEIALKGRNRYAFQRRLRNNMLTALRGEPVQSLLHVESRMLVRLADPSRAEAVADKLGRVFGVAWLSTAASVPRGPAATAEVSCTNAACHPRSAPASKQACGSCHAVAISLHETAHDASAYLTTGCTKCHGTMLDAIHSGECCTCHASANPLVALAVASASRACTACHPDLAHFGRQR